MDVLGCEMRCFQSGHCVADPAWQWKAFGCVPTTEEGVVRWLRGAGLAPTLLAAGASASAGQGPKKG